MLNPKLAKENVCKCSSELVFCTRYICGESGGGAFKFAMGTHTQPRKCGKKIVLFLEWMQFARISIRSLKVLVFKKKGNFHSFTFILVLIRGYFWSKSCLGGKIWQ